MEATGTRSLNVVQDFTLVKDYLVDKFRMVYPFNSLTLITISYFLNDLELHDTGDKLIFQEINFLLFH